MNVDEVLRELARRGGYLPREAIQWSLDHWDEVRPRFIELLDRCASGSDRTDATLSALFFIVHLLAEKRETSAFPGLCLLLQDAGLTESILDDAIAATLTKVLVALYDGTPGLLTRLIETPTVDDLVRGDALKAWAYLGRQGAFTDDEMRAYLLHLYQQMHPRSVAHVWSTWVMVVANLGYPDYAGKVRNLLDRGFIGRFDLHWDDFDRQFRRTLADPDRMAGFAADRIEPFTGTIGTFAKWYCFSERYRTELARRSQPSSPDLNLVTDGRRPFWLGDDDYSESPNDDELSWDDEDDTVPPDDDAPLYNPLRYLGRNDPCPCGSGKKYKKCCLA